MEEAQELLDAKVASILQGARRLGFWEDKREDRREAMISWLAECFRRIDQRYGYDPASVADARAIEAYRRNNPGDRF